ncbi:MAG: hypothetical protein A4E63_03561 [Syntrophorhabdus sp. PtaU1.Bin050]|jgi:hypothetical protein|nr:MAG: hypothetical protein A4E63_03561 [Syntrophorhabdus sp. PtaU1.Bin050]
MMKKVMVVFLAVVCVAWVMGCSKGPNLKDGLWEITTKVEMQGMPVPFAIPEQKVTQCITKKDAVPQKAEKNQDCKMVSSKVTGDTVAWTMECRTQEGAKTDSQGTVTYKGDTFEGVTNVTVTPPGQNTMKMTQSMSGRRIGECKE